MIKTEPIEEKAVKVIKGHRPFLAYLLMLLLGVIGFYVGKIYYRPVRFSESFLIVIILSIPPSLLLAWAGRKIKWKGVSGSNSKLMLFYFVASLSFISQFAIFANYAFDRSIAREQALIVENKYSYRRFSLIYNEVITVKSPFHPATFIVFDDEERLGIMPSQFNDVQPGKTQIDLVIHDGFLRLPWISDYWIRK